jgi:hypothetical protein
MTQGTPLFSQQELARAFALVVPDDRASELSADWFAEGDVDQLGNYLYRDWEFDPRPPSPATDGPQIVAGGTGVSNDFSPWRNLSERSKELMLEGFSDFHLDLLSLVSPELFERIRTIRCDTEATALRRSDRMRLFISAIQ